MRLTLRQIKDGTGFDRDAVFETVEDYNGYTNRETWLVALWIDNDQGWQESVHDRLRQWSADMAGLADDAWSRETAGDVIRESVEEAIWGDESPASLATDLLGTALARADWTELGATFLAAVAEIDQSDA